MILGIDRHPQAACFVEIDEAVRHLRGKDDVAFNAHTFDAPEGCIVFQTECIPEQVSADRFAGRTVWDLSSRNAAQYHAEYVPIGYHPSFERFVPAAERDIDVVFSGCLSPRRIAVLEALAARGLHVVVIAPGVYGAARDAVLARSRLALNMLYEPDRVFPALRVAHLVANRVPVLSERCRDGWAFVPTCEYEDIVDVAARIVADPSRASDNAAHSYERFIKMPMVLP